MNTNGVAFYYKIQIKCDTVYITFGFKMKF